MRCLNDVEVQAVVDEESTDAIRRHVAECRRCAARVDERRRHMSELSEIVEDGGPVPASLASRVRDAVTSERAVRGATALRQTGAAASWRRVGWASALATAAVVALVVFLVLPRFGAPTTLSASEILGRSLQTLTAAHGVELLEYELTIGGFGDGPRRIQQLIDRDHPNRYRLSNFGPDGALESAISQDPAAGRRTQLIRVDGRNYIVNLTLVRDPRVSLPQMAQAQIEVVIAMMQATADQKLTIEDGPDGRQYIIQVPPVTPKSGAGMLDLYQARTVIDARDFRIREFEASGTLLKQPYTVSFRLIRQTIRNAEGVPASEFEIPAGPNDIVFDGEATNDPLTDVLTTVLREVGRVRGH